MIYQYESNFTDSEWISFFTDLPERIFLVIQGAIDWFNNYFSDLLGTFAFQKSFLLLLLISFVVMFILKSRSTVTVK